MPGSFCRHGCREFSFDILLGGQTQAEAETATLLARLASRGSVRFLGVYFTDEIFQLHFE